MTTTEALISGIVQGVTEFLPVSSSGHLVLLHRFFGLSEPGIFFDICLHVATLMAVILYFGKDIRNLVKQRNTRWLFCVALGTVPAVAAALLFGEYVSSFFMSPVKVSLMLIVTALVLFLSPLSLLRKARPGKGPTFRTSLLVGIAQAFALFPGISRSGVTISTGLLGGIKAEEAFRFSFLLSIPIIIGATLHKALTLDMAEAVSGNLANYIAGMSTAFTVGFFSLRFLWKAVKSERLFIFGAYCLLIGIAGLLFWKH